MNLFESAEGIDLMHRIARGLEAIAEQELVTVEVEQGVKQDGKILTWTSAGEAVVKMSDNSCRVVRPFQITFKFR